MQTDLTCSQATAAETASGQRDLQVSLSLCLSAPASRCVARASHPFNARRCMTTAAVAWQSIQQIIPVSDSRQKHSLVTSLCTRAAGDRGMCLHSWDAHRTSACMHAVPSFSPLIYGSSFDARRLSVRDARRRESQQLHVASPAAAAHPSSPLGHLAPL